MQKESNKCPHGDAVKRYQGEQQGLLTHILMLSLHSIPSPIYIFHLPYISRALHSQPEVAWPMDKKPKGDSESSPQE